LAPELVLMGLRLSKLNGPQAASHIKRSIDPPVVFMVSSDDSPSSRAISEAAGADAFVPTSGDLEVRLKSRLHEWFRPKRTRLPNR
jgi:CheY-like chemotaxis protein